MMTTGCGGGVQLGGGVSVVHAWPCPVKKRGRVACGAPTRRVAVVRDALSGVDGVEDLLDGAALPEVPPTFAVVLSRGLGATASIAHDVAVSLRHSMDNHRCWSLAEYVGSALSSSRRAIHRQRMMSSSLGVPNLGIDGTARLHVLMRQPDGNRESSGT